MAVLRTPEPVRPVNGGPPAELRDWAAPCWHKVPPGTDWVPAYIEAVNTWSRANGFALASSGNADWIRLSREHGIQRPRRLQRWPV